MGKSSLENNENLEELIREELEEHERICSRIPAYNLEEARREKRIKKAEEEYDNLLKNDSIKYPVFAFNFRDIRKYWKNLPDYETCDEYLNYAEGQHEHRTARFTSILIDMMDIGQYIVNPIPPEGTEEALRIHNTFLNTISEKLGIDPIFAVKYPWMVYDEQTNAMRFDRNKIEVFFTAMFELERQELKYFRDRGDIPRRDKRSKKGETDHRAEKSNGKTDGKATWYLYKFQCPEDEIKRIDKAFQKLSHEASLKLPENFNILNYFSVNHEKKDIKKLREQAIDWAIPEDLAGFVAFIEILKKDYGVKMMPSAVKATFTRAGNLVGSYETYKRSKNATGGFEKRTKIEERKSQLKKILELN